MFSIGAGPVEEGSTLVDRVRAILHAWVPMMGSLQAMAATHNQSSRLVVHPRDAMGSMRLAATGSRAVERHVDGRMRERHARMRMARGMPEE